MIPLMIDLLSNTLRKLTLSTPRLRPRCDWVLQFVLFFNGLSGRSYEVSH
jgi:hypothetical protein